MELGAPLGDSRLYGTRGGPGGGLLPVSDRTAGHVPGRLGLVYPANPRIPHTLTAGPAQGDQACKVIWS